MSLFCSGDECLEVWPEGPLPEGWTVENVEGRIEPCCADCTAFYAAQATPQWADHTYDPQSGTTQGSCARCGRGVQQHPESVRDIR